MHYKDNFSSEKKNLIFPVRCGEPNSIRLRCERNFNLLFVQQYFCSKSFNAYFHQDYRIIRMSYKKKNYYTLIPTCIKTPSLPPRRASVSILRPPLRVGKMTGCSCYYFYYYYDFFFFHYYYDYSYERVLVYIWLL